MNDTIAPQIKKALFFVLSTASAFFVINCLLLDFFHAIENVEFL